MRLKNILRVSLTVLLLAGLLACAARLQRREESRPVPDAVLTPGQETETPASPWAGKLVITELMEKNKSVLADEDGDFSDWIELYNAADSALDLTGFWPTARGTGPGSSRRRSCQQAAACWSLPTKRTAAARCCTQTSDCRRGSTSASGTARAGR